MWKRSLAKDGVHSLLYLKASYLIVHVIAHLAALLQLAPQLHERLIIFFYVSLPVLATSGRVHNSWARGGLAELLQIPSIFSYLLYVWDGHK